MNVWSILTGNTRSCISVASLSHAKESHSWGCRSICLHQHLLVLPQHAARTCGAMQGLCNAQLKHRDMQVYTERKAKCQQNATVLQTNRTVFCFCCCKSDETCGLLPNYTRDCFNANVIKRAWRAPICCRHLHTEKEGGRIYRRFHNKRPHFSRFSGGWKQTDSWI